MKNPPAQYLLILVLLMVSWSCGPGPEPVQPVTKTRAKKPVSVDEVDIVDPDAPKVRPGLTMVAQGDVMDLVRRDDLLYVATNKGTVEIFEIGSGTRIRLLELPHIKNYYDETFPPPIFSVDLSPSKQRLLLVAGAKGGDRTLLIEENDSIRPVIEAEEKLLIHKARFIEDDLIFLAVTGNEILLWDLAADSARYTKHLSNASFSDFALGLDKSRVAMGNESGAIPIVNVADGKTLKMLSKGNLDKVFRLDYKAGKVAAGGRDRRVAVYEQDGSYRRYRAHFFVYTVALSQDGKLLAFTFNEANDVTVIDLAMERQVHLLEGQGLSLNKLFFSGERTLVGAGDGREIYSWSFL